MRRKHKLLAVLVGACLMLVSPPICRAAVFTVTLFTDTGGSTGNTGDLRWAINQSNTTPGTNTIALAETGTIALSATLPAITSNLTITGPTSVSWGITIDGNNSVQIMQVNSGATVTLQFLTLADGRLVGASGTSEQGGAILNLGTLTVTDCTLWTNRAIGGAGGGLGEGGAIYNSGTLTITNSTFYNNSAIGGASMMVGGDGDGGAIYNRSGTLTVTNTTFSVNEATGGAGGGVGQGGAGQGGAIWNELGATLTMTNATFWEASATPSSTKAP